MELQNLSAIRISKQPQITHDDDSSITASESEPEDCQKPCTSLHTNINDNLQNQNSQEINSVQIGNSSNIHIGTKTFYNAPVTIKQFFLTDEVNEKRKNSDNNKNCDGSSNNKIESDANVKKRKKFKFLMIFVAVVCVLLAVIPLIFIIFPLFEDPDGERKLLMILVAAVCVLLAILNIFSLFKGDYEEDKTKVTEESQTTISVTEKPQTTISVTEKPQTLTKITEEPQTTTTFAENPLQIILRKDWKARNPIGEQFLMILPASRIIIAHTAQSECFSLPACKTNVQNAQIWQIENHFIDIKYNFLIGGDGSIFEGRGWRIAGDLTNGFNTNSIGVAFIGNFTKTLPNEKQLEAGFRLFAEGVRIKALREDYQIFGACQFQPTASPGFMFMKLVQTWPRNQISIITKSMWNGQPSKDQLTKLNLPVSKVIIAHTVTPECDTKDLCIKRMQNIQSDHMGTTNNYDDIGYNFVISGDGNVYEGRGWNYAGAHTRGYNSESIGIGYIGTFTSKKPNEKQLIAGFQLFNEGLRVNALAGDYQIYGASQLKITESPGREFMKLIRKWPRWIGENFQKNEK